MRNKLLPSQNHPAAPVTYWFKGGSLRIEIEWREDSKLYNLYVTHHDFDNERILAKEAIDSIRVDSLQYANTGFCIAYLATLTRITIYNFIEKTFHDLNFEYNILTFVMDNKAENFAALDQHQRLIITNRNDHSNIVYANVIAMTQRESQLYYLTTQGELFQTCLKRPEKCEKTSVSLKSYLSNERMIVSVHPTMPIIAFTNNTFDLKGQRRSIILCHLHSGKTLGVISKITSLIINIRWLPQTNRLLCLSRSESLLRDVPANTLGQPPTHDLIDLIALDNFHDHLVLECDQITTQVFSDAQECLVLTSQFYRAQGWDIPLRQSVVDKLTFQIRLSNGQPLKLNGIALLKILHRSVEEILAPIVVQNQNSNPSELRKIRGGLDWLKTAGRLATCVSGEVMNEPHCRFVREDAKKLYGTLTLGLPGQHQTNVFTKREEVTIQHAKSGSYVHIAEYINQFLDGKTLKISTEVVYQSMCAALNPEIEQPLIPVNLEHANLATILLARLQGQDFPSDLPTQIKEFLDSLLVLMFGMETSRINATYLTGVMVLDLIKNHCTFGRFHRVFSWQNIFTSGPGYHWNDFEQKDLGGKFPVASNSTGPDNFVHRNSILNCQEADELLCLNVVLNEYQHNRIIKKEIHIILHWLYNLSKEHVDFLANSTDVTVLKQRLAQLFQQRLKDAYSLQPVSNIPMMLPNQSPEIRQYELRIQSQQLTGVPHYYLNVTNMATKAVRTDQYYHRTDIPCKMIAADFISGASKVIKPNSIKQETRADINLARRSIVGIKKVFMKSSLKDSVIATQEEVFNFSGRSLRVRTPLEETLTSFMEELITGKRRPNNVQTKRQRVDETNVLHRPPLTVPLCLLISRYIETVSMPYFDFFASIPDDCRDNLSAREKLFYENSLVDKQWLKIVPNPAVLYRILQNISFINVRDNPESYTGEITIDSILRNINQFAHLSEENAFELALNIFQSIERQLFSQTSTITSFYNPEIFAVNLIFNSAYGSPAFAPHPKPAFVQKITELANAVSPHNLANEEALKLATKIIHGLTLFHFERQIVVKLNNNHELAPCPRCFSETAPLYPALPYDYDQTVCLVAHEHSYYHRIMSNEEGKGCPWVDTNHYHIVDTRHDPPPPLQTMRTFVKHAVQTLHKLACQECWLPLARANAKQRENQHRDDNQQQNTVGRFFRTPLEQPSQVLRVDEIPSAINSPRVPSSEQPFKRHRDRSPVLAAKTSASQVRQILFHHSSHNSLDPEECSPKNPYQLPSLFNYLIWSLQRDTRLRVLDKYIFALSNVKTLRDQLINILSIIEAMMVPSSSFMEIPFVSVLLESCDTFLLHIDSNVEDPREFYQQKLKDSNTTYCSQAAVKLKSDINHDINDAITFFVASECGKNQRDFDVWYHQKLMPVLMCAEAAACSNISDLSYIFYFAHSELMDAGSIPYETHLRHVVAYGNLNKKPVLMISVEPGVGQNHYIVTIVIEKTVYIINPMGRTAHRDMYQSLLTMQQQNIIHNVNIYEAGRPLQHDPQGIIVSCGPICVELCRILSRYQNISQMLMNIGLKPTQHHKTGLKYMSFDIISFILGTSLEKLGECSQDDYVEKILAIRQFHSELLRKLNQEVQVDFLEEQKAVSDIIKNILAEVKPNVHDAANEDDLLEENEGSEDNSFGQ